MTEQEKSPIASSARLSQSRSRPFDPEFMNIPADEWHRLHELCPECYERNYYITTDGSRSNSVICFCGWHGYEWELLPRGACKIPSHHISQKVPS